MKMKKLTVFLFFLSLQISYSTVIKKSIDPRALDFKAQLEQEHPSLFDENKYLSAEEVNIIERKIYEWEKESDILFDRSDIVKKLGSKYQEELKDKDKKDVQIHPLSQRILSKNAADKKLMNSLRQDQRYGYRENYSRYNYTYDNSGNCTEYTGEKFYSYYWYNSFRWLLSYNNNGDLTEELYQTWHSGEWINYRHYTYDWDQYGNQTLFSRQSWNDSSWTYDYKYIWSYDVNGNQIEFSYQNWTNGEMDWGYKYLFSYNDQNNITELINQDLVEGQWQNDYRWTYSYDALDVQTKSLKDDWVNDSWQPSYRWTNTADANGNIVQSFGEDWYNEQWNTDAMYTNSYNSENRIMESIYQIRSGQSWVNSSRYTYDYDAMGNETLFLKQYWENDSWVNYYQYTSEFDANGNWLIYTYLRWSGGEISYGRKYIYEYDAKGNSTLFVRQTWENGGWENWYKYEYVYNNSGNLLQYYFYDWLEGEWIEWSRSYYGYENSAPVLPAIVSRLANAQSYFRMRVYAVGDPAVSYSLLSAPDGMTINANDGYIFWSNYPETGEFAVTVQAQNDNGSMEQSFQISILNHHAMITKISDVPNDQGGRVFITFMPSFYDHKRTISQYGVWSKDKNGDWFSVGNVPATQNTEAYKFLAPTLGDSTKSHGQFWSYFKITAHSSSSYSYYYTSPVDSGYSLDNLAPAIPSNVMIKKYDGTITLNWSGALERDFQYYEIYRNEILLSCSTESEFIDDNPGDENIYKIFSVDYAGNKSEPYVSEMITAIEDEIAIPTEFSLSQNYPNPFNPQTTIRYGLPEAGKVKIEIYNSRGRKVSTILDSNKPAGYYFVTFDGSGLASGVYIYRLITNTGFSQTKKMILIR